MFQTDPTLHLMCGKIASGKSTLTTKLGAHPATIVIAEDTWLSALYADVMLSVADYVRCASKLRGIMGPHIVALLNAGTSVVLDFPANTVETRMWMRSLLDQTEAAHQLHVFDVPDALCLDRLRRRNAQTDHPFSVTETQYWQMSKYFVAPTPDEGFNIVLHTVEPDR
ncbi:AAA family ATPase [Celeribacter baekdonensis]|uniref:AAA family ATPase n=1 Tax=Celeribacter baekdonensis TaxID=875171 RepID=UPI003A9238DB